MFLLLSYFHVICDDVNVFFFIVLSEPVAFYPLNARYKATEKENRQPKGILGDVSITHGPYNEPGGAYMFYGTNSSYIEFPNDGGLDTWFSITLMCWVRPGGRDGPLFSYEKDDRVVQIFSVQPTLTFILIDQPEFIVIVANDLLTEVWVHVAATYNYYTGNGSLFINGHLNASSHKHISHPIATEADKVQMGVNAGMYFKGKITEMKVYDVALDEAQIQTSIRQGS